MELDSALDGTGLGTELCTGLGTELGTGLGSSTGRDSETMSKRWGWLQVGIMTSLSLRSSFALSATVSVQAEKFGGEGIHPMGFVMGIPIRDGSFFCVGNNTAR